MIKSTKPLLLAAVMVAGMCWGQLSFAAKNKEPAATPASAPAPAVSESTAPSAPAPMSTATEAQSSEMAKSAPTANTPNEEENPYGLGALWDQGDIVAKTTLAILLLMSMGSWYVIITKFLDQSKVGKFATVAQAYTWTSQNLRQGAQTLSEESPFRFVAEKGLEAAQKHTSVSATVDFNTWTSQSIQRAIVNVQSRMQDGLAVLATVGSTSPFVGLFGTVWGIYNALVKIGMSGQASIDKVAGPVGESLIMTAIGLAVAVPAVLGYNWLVRRNKSAMEDLNTFASDFHSVLLSTHNK
jgi:biopolymer transport protein ExbB